MQEKKCKSCLCYDPKSGYCQVNILINEKKMKLPVFAEDNCHFHRLSCGGPCKTLNICILYFLLHLKR